jgi:4-alpha-glucanotransferase
MSTSSRVAGVTIPLSSIRTQRDWGIGQIADLPAFARWILTAGHRLVQILPPYELAPGETSPYGARTAFGIDPLYVTVEEVPDLDPTDIDWALGADGHAERERLRALPRVDFGSVRDLKTRVLRRAFERFHEVEWKHDTPRAKALRAFIEEQSWVTDLALYVALRNHHNQWSWQHWPDGERHHDPQALSSFEEKLALPILEYEYVQWLLDEQWQRAKREVNRLGVELMGDLPFIVGTESADVWAHPAEFRRDVSLGAPPDAFSEDGQDWGLPAYDWHAMDKSDLAWIRARTRHAATLYDRFRLDHVVGYFRMYVRPPSFPSPPSSSASLSPPPPVVRTPRGWFDPEGDEQQEARGRRVLSIIQAEARSTRVIGEDLGVIPPFVRRTLTALELPGYRVLPWENDDGRFRDPKGYPASSVATWSTHDTAPIGSWWDDLSGHDRGELSRLANMSGGAASSEEGRWLPLMRMLLGSSSELTLTLPQEILGEHARINTPGTVGEGNWTYRLPKPVELLLRDPDVARRMETLREVVRESGR